ncbi:MAG: hypothetical protein RSA67_02200, partial [Alistipes sp.]
AKAISTVTLRPLDKLEDRELFKVFATSRLARGSGGVYTMEDGFPPAWRNRMAKIAEFGIILASTQIIHRP